MQITIEEHNAVMTGLATELVVRDRHTQDVEANLEEARKLIHAMDATGKQMGEELISLQENYDAKLDRIRQVANGMLAGLVTPSDEPEWSTALVAVESLHAKYMAMIKDNTLLRVALDAKLKRARKK
jgi:hypothetical protein